MDIVQRRDEEYPGNFGYAQAGCTACPEKLLQQHKGLIHFIVRRQCPEQADYADLIQAGWSVAGWPSRSPPRLAAALHTAVL